MLNRRRGLSRRRALQGPMRQTSACKSERFVEARCSFLKMSESQKSKMCTALRREANNKRAQPDRTPFRVDETVVFEKNERFVETKRGGADPHTTTIIIH